MIQVPLTKGYVAVVDDEDSWVLAHKWHAKPKPTGVYACHNELGYLHRAVVGETNPRVLVDHRDGDGLNCRRENLRRASRTVNRRNSRTHRGVFFYTARGYNKWAAYISVAKKRKHLGYFDTEAEALQARLAAERTLWGIEPQREALHG